MSAGPDSPEEVRSFLEVVEEFLHRHDIREKKILVAVSGGADSVALLHALHRMAEPCSLSLHVAHLDHMLRGSQGERDSRFVEKLASSLGLPFTAERRDVREYAKAHKISSAEDAARRVRHRFLDDVADEVGAHVIALGHTADDQAETVLLQLVRGTGLAGLRGMLPFRDRIIRPLLTLRRRDIESFLDHLGADFVVDESNLDLALVRNRIRREILPLLEEHFNPRVVENICRTARLVGSVDQWVDVTVEALLQDSVTDRDEEGLRLRVQSLSLVPQFLRLSVIRRAVAEIMGKPSRLTSKHLLSLDDLLSPNTTRGEVSLPEGLRAERRGEVLALTRGKREGPTEDWEVALDVPGSLQVPGSDIEIRFDILERSATHPDQPATPPHEAYLDLDTITRPLVVRNRRKGDRFHPLGAPGSRKLKDFFIDQKVPRELRDRVPLLVDQEGIICVLGFVIGERCRTRHETRRLLHIVMSETVS